MVLNCVTTLGALFLVVPIVVTIVVSFNPNGFVLPPEGFTLRWYQMALTSSDFIDGMAVSTMLALAAAILANCIGLPLAIAMARREFVGKEIINLLVMSPLLIPTIILGLALFVTISHLGLIGGLPALIMGHTVLVLPFAVRVLLASLQSFDRTLEEASMSVGANQIETLVRITLPVIKTGLVASFILCFIISWNDFGLSIFLASSDWLPLPIQIYTYIKFQYDASSAALVSFIVFLSVALLILVDRLIGIQKAFGGK